MGRGDSGVGVMVRDDEEWEQWSVVIVEWEQLSVLTSGVGAMVRCDKWSGSNGPW